VEDYKLKLKSMEPSVKEEVEEIPELDIDSSYSDEIESVLEGQSLSKTAGLDELQSVRQSVLS
jgi:hypothetical protein